MLIIHWPLHLCTVVHAQTSVSLNEVLTVQPILGRASLRGGLQLTREGWNSARQNVQHLVELLVQLLVSEGVFGMLAGLASNVMEAWFYWIS